MEVKSPNPSIQEQIALFHKDLFGSDEDSSISGDFDGKTVEEEIKKESVPIVSPCLGKNKKRARKGKARLLDYGPMDESVMMGKNFQSFVTEKRLISLRKEFQIPDSITLRAPSTDERPCNVQGDEVAVCMDAIYSGLRLPIQPYFRKVLHAMGLAPIQLNPNVYRYLAALFVLFSKLHLGEPTVAELVSIYALKSHPSSGCINKNYGVYYLSHSKDVAIIRGVPTSNKTWRRHWFWVGGNWRAEFDLKLLPDNERVFNEVQGQLNWSGARISKRQRERIGLALTVEEESREWARLTDELALYQGDLINIPPENGTDFPLKFKTIEHSPERRADGEEEVNSKDPRSVGEL